VRGWLSDQGRMCLYVLPEERVLKPGLSFAEGGIRFALSGRQLCRGGALAQAGHRWKASGGAGDVHQEPRAASTRRHLAALQRHPCLRVFPCPSNLLGTSDEPLHIGARINIGEHRGIARHGQPRPEQVARACIAVCGLERGK
jgi:hypothetical protein